MDGIRGFPYFVPRKKTFHAEGRAYPGKGMLPTVRGSHAGAGKIRFADACAEWQLSERIGIQLTASPGLVAVDGSSRCGTPTCRLQPSRQYPAAVICPGMCGRFTLHTPEARIRDVFHLGHTEPQGLVPRFNIAPSQDVHIIRNTGTGPEMVLARWGLVPGWSRESTTRYSTINARIETVAEKPAFRIPFKRQRCLIPADGFYEWQVVNGNKIPHYIRRPDGDVFAFAGLWDHWTGNGESLLSCSIIVMPANEVMRPLHERMPVILAPACHDPWLDTGITEKQTLMKYLNSASLYRLTCYPVDKWVNTPRHDDERCIRPAG